MWINRLWDLMTSATYNIPTHTDNTLSWYHQTQLHKQSVLSLTENDNLNICKTLILFINHLMSLCKVKYFLHIAIKNGQLNWLAIYRYLLPVDNTAFFIPIVSLCSHTNPATGDVIPLMGPNWLIIIIKSDISVLLFHTWMLM